MAPSFIQRYILIYSFFLVFLVHGVSDGDTDSVFVNEGDSVTLYTGVTTNQVGVKWYFHDTRIAQIGVNLSFICTDVQCNEGTGRFRDRLKLDHQTGSLTITNISTEHTGLYQPKSTGRVINLIFRVAVYKFPAAQQEVKRKSVKEGEPVPLDPRENKNTSDVMRWYFNDTLIAETTGDQSDERFRDRLKLDHQTGSLTITNTKITDSGDYKLEITRKWNRFSITSVESFSVNVTESGVSPGAVAGICVLAFVAVAVAVAVVVGVGVIYWRRKRSRKDDDKSVVLDVVETDGETPWQHDRRGSEEDQFEDSSSVLLQT